MEYKEHMYPALVFATGLLVLFLSFFLDQFFVGFIDNIRNPVFTYVLNWASYALSLVFVLLIMTSLFMWEEGKRDWIIPTWMAFFIALILTLILKVIVARERPETYGFALLGSQYSFPSSHTAACFSLVALLDKVYPMLKWFWVGFGVLVAFSRIYLGAHFLSDVLAGGLLGFAIGLAVVYIKEKYNLFGAG
ncbi:MAG: phosphatase PAP2 family protein [Candidatus Nanoarchaeia archaeon]